MKPSKRYMLRCLAALFASQAGWAMAQYPARCEWLTGTGPMVWQATLGTLYVPRDAAPGAVIGRLDTRTFLGDANNTVNCWTSDTATRTLEFEARATAPIFSGPLPPLNGEDLTGKVLQTNVPGIGARLKLMYPFIGPGPNQFVPVETPTVPFRAIRPPVLQGIPIWINGMEYRFTLIKTGDIPPGAHQLNGSELFSGHVSDLGHILGFGINGTVIQSQCSVSVNPVSADPVLLGDWNTSDFTGPGFTTTNVPFSIALSNCDTDPANGGNIATANIRLDGINGSLPVGEPDIGVFSLTSDSTAQGVGIQVLRENGTTPVELSTDVPLVAITPGNVALNFNARFYQTGASRDVKPGLAKGSLSFTLTYR